MTSQQAIEKAERRLSQCCYNAETLNNRGLATAYNNESEWLSVVVYLAKKALKGGEA